MGFQRGLARRWFGFAERACLRLALAVPSWTPFPLYLDITVWLLKRARAASRKLGEIS
ncbi:MAG: hypothetical protein WB816_11955 [Methylocystis sp.]